ncbi:MAG: UDP-N-acetylmuramate--L-alanine ligase [Patescibacteria group bacterium]|nr:UDP-N-acetylmuramate--L-alanine ligase [Patescibacteria group bacterium]
MKNIAPKHYFFVGIGGIGMQALADILLGLGCEITGSDIAEFPAKDRLISRKATVIIGKQVAENVPEDIDCLVYTSAILHHQGAHPEVEKAKELGVPIFKRSEFIGELMKDKNSIAVSGTHGKTTVSTMLTLMLQAGGLNPTALIGAEVKNLEGCGIWGTGEHMVVEACEYDRAFLDMNPKIAVLTSVEADHLDYYEDIEDIKGAFTEFLNKVPADGYSVVYGDDPNIQAILSKIKGRVITFGFREGNDFVIKNINYKDQQMHFEADGIKTYMNFPGKHLVLDAVAALIVAKKLGVSDSAIKQVLEKDYKGADRRFEMLGTFKGVVFVDDYGHHPTEVKMVLSAVKDFFPNRRLLVVFQPHQFSRTKLLLAGFAKSFVDADKVFLAPILAVRDSEEDKKSINNTVLAEEINKVSANSKAFESFGEITEVIKSELKDGDVLISLGAGKNSEWIRELILEFKQ